ncbi:MAG: N-acetyl-L,L-diaminopimelate deacetylase (EC [uncultured Aureispira sp.]|uniref:N-acetyl-L,L-diaminopimelate deacetylase (EC) n=1 Tax=uncultured Aureispira sp. TaxID=1331704 RepID=A0A6S6RY26_9BACT|nr:MAG: N-acetyl-L,L-diaminopimelate deacetylase (EC [uncultured Aureispira sp.]
MLIPTNIITETIQTRRHLHQYPELGSEVYQTVALVEKQLRALGLDVHPNIGKNGLYADLNVPNAQKRIALRADMDALPIQELGQKDYQSTINGLAHMCGHDAHTAMLLGAAKLIVQHKDQLQHNIRFVFQPDEENIPGGALPMIKDGVLDGVDKIYGQHVWPTLDTGVIGLCSGPAMGQPDVLKILITGKGGHAAYPHSTIDPIVIAAQYINAVQAIVARNVPALDAAVVSFTIIEAGTAHNIIPESIQLTASIRTLSLEVKANLKKRLHQLLESICAAHAASFDFNYINGHALTYNDPALAKDLANLLEADKLVFPHPPSMAGEDFGYYSQKIPACFIFLGCRNEAKGITAMLHSPHFDLDEACIETGIGLWYTIAMQD